VASKVGKGSLKAVTPATEKHPSYKGSITIGDKRFWLSGWKRTGDDGRPWLSLSVEAADEPAEQPARTYAQRRDYDDSEVPF
jgi:uncharacterized protein (DUF736 family)